MIPSTTTNTKSAPSTANSTAHVPGNVNEKKLLTFKHKENLVYINARSVLCNLNHIEIMSKKVKPLMILCSEARVTNEISEEIKVDGYNEIVCASSTRFTGGVVIYVQKQIKFRIVYMNSIDKNFWCLAIEILNENMSGIYSVFYRANNADNKIFEESFDEFLSKTLKHNKLNVCVGDLNLNMNYGSKSVRQFNEICDMNGIYYVSNFYTRITQDSQTKIDVVLTNNRNRVACQPLPNEKISDHETIKIEISNDKNNDFKKTQLVNSWKNYNKDQLIDNLRNKNWSNFDDMEIDDMIDLIRKNIESAANPMIKKVEIRSDTNNKTWFDQQLKNLKQQRNEKYFKWNKNRTTDNWTDYIETRNIYNKLINSKKDTSIKNEIKKTGRNQKSLWKCLNKLLPNKKNNTISGEIIFDDGATTNEIEISNKFNRFFIDSVIKINSQIPNQVGRIEPIWPNNMFRFKHVNVEQIYQITKQLTKKINKSQICNSMVWNDAIEYVGYHLCKIINKSFDEGKFPDRWKISTITPIPKIKNTNKCDEFRPINSMPNDEKIIECAVKQQLLEYINSNNILYENQSAYRTNHSCESALNLLIFDWKVSIENGEIVIAVFLDLKRAFETISGDIMAIKLENIGIVGEELNWFKSYMNNRKQKVNYNNKFSNVNDIPIGLPQGTQLSVILFLLYINDIAKATDFGKIYLFADDTVLVVRNRDIDTAIKQTNHDLGNVYNWLNLNKLKLNTNKTEYMAISKKKLIIDQNCIIIGNEAIKRVEHVKYLGFYLDENLNFNKQIDVLRKKLASKINFMKRISKKLTFDTKKTIYNAIIAPHFEYCSTLYINCNKEQIDTLQKLQNRAMRIILNCEFRTHINDMLETLDWLNITQKIKHNIIMYVFKMKNEQTPQYLSNKLEYSRDMHNRNTRSRNELRLPKFKSDFGRKNIFYNGVKMYNDLPIEMKNETNLNKFKKLLLSYVKKL